MPKNDCIVVDAGLHAVGDTMTFLHGKAGTVPVERAPNGTLFVRLWLNAYQLSARAAGSGQLGATAPAPPDAVTTVLCRGARRRGHRRQRLDALAALRREQPGAVVGKRSYPVGVAEHLTRPDPRIGAEPSIRCVAVVKIHMSPPGRLEIFTPTQPRRPSLQAPSTGQAQGLR